MSFEPLYEAAQRSVIRAWLVATMHELGRMFGRDIGGVHEIARRDFTDEESERSHIAEPPL
jgi:hypothetical protein